MEVFYDSLLIANLIINLILYRCVKSNYASSENLYRETHEYLESMINIMESEDQKINDRIDCLNNRLDILAATVNPPTQPNKPNNWNSVRSAFKGPVRIEIND